MKKSVFLYSLITLAAASVAKAQMVSNGGAIFIDASAVVYLDNSLKALPGSEIMNNGQFYISGDLTNNSDDELFSLSSTGTMILSGNEQELKGNSSITLYNLVLQQDNVKTVSTELNVRNSLELNNAVINANENIYIENPDTGAISRTSGYIATQKDALLKRYTSQANGRYTFPLGSLSQNYYQPVDIVTRGDEKSIFGVTLHDYDPSYSGFSTSSKEDSIKKVNDSYYYTIDRLEGEDRASLSFYSNSQDAADQVAIGTWDKEKNKWTLPYPASVLSGNYGKQLNRKLFISDPTFTEKEYTTVSIEQRTVSKLIQIPNSFTSNGDGLNDYWEIKGIEKFPSNHVAIYNRWGEIIFETRGYSASNHFDGANVMQGVYMFVVEVSDNKGYSKTYNGDLTILR